MTAEWRGGLVKVGADLYTFFSCIWTGRCVAAVLFITPPDNLQMYP